MGLQGKVHSMVREIHGCPPGFSGFSVALPSISQKKERENAVVYFLRQVAVEVACSKVYPVSEGTCFLSMSPWIEENKKKMG